jgi:hypothetical protein
MEGRPAWIVPASPGQVSDLLLEEFSKAMRLDPSTSDASLPVLHFLPDAPPPGQR